MAMYTTAEDFFKAEASWVPANRKSILGFTNGCFDLLHAGHVTYLKQARECCDFLVVGLNTDQSIKKIKGLTRPIQDQESRATILSALRFVDGVILFSQDTPHELIAQLQPDRLFKGNDYQGQIVVGQDLVEQRGGKVMLLPFIEGQSTTLLEERILKGRGTAS